jgi:hypothetical protein
MRVLLAFAVPFFAFASLHSARAESIDVGGWKVERADDKSTCTLLSVSDDKKGGFLMGVNTGNLAFIGLVDTELTLKPGENYQASYHVDGDAPTKIVGQSASPTTYLLPLGSWKDAQPIFDTASAGNTVYLDIGGASYEYSLTGSKDAIASFDKCAASIGMPSPQ